MKYYWLLLLVSLPYLAFSQEPRKVTVYNATAQDSITVDLEGTTIYANDQLDVASIIHIIQTDTTFYKAFKNLHFSNYNADNILRVYDKKGKSTIATYQSETKHIYRNRCRWMHILEENYTPNYYKKARDARFYTAALYENLFLTFDTICNELNQLDKAYLNPSGSVIERNKAQLKQLLFSPGRKISGIPFMGKSAAIFDQEIAALYTFNIKKESKNGVTCFLFEATPKPEHKSKVVYQQFKTWLDVNDYSMVAREYVLQYHTSVYDFNVAMKVNLTKKDNKMLPSFISYNGNWRVATQGREIVTFQTHFYH